jgi:hypothetical protein
MQLERTRIPDLPNTVPAYPCAAPFFFDDAFFRLVAVLCHGQSLPFRDFRPVLGTVTSYSLVPETFLPITAIFASPVLEPACLIVLMNSSGGSITVLRRRPLQLYVIRSRFYCQGLNETRRTTQTTARLATLCPLSKASPIGFVSTL